MPSRKGFTLTELLAVIAILSILAAILFPTFVKARQDPQSVVCASNMKQLGLAFLQYVQDNDMHYPNTAVSSSYQFCGANVGAGWGSSVYPYVAGWKSPPTGSITNASIFTCPSDPTTPASPGRTVDSYAVNMLILAGTLASDAPCDAGAKVGISGALSALNYPARTVLLCEITNNGWSRPATKYDPETTATDGVGWAAPSHGMGTATGVSATGWLAGMTAASKIDVAQFGRHMDGSNFLACDGHTQWLRGSMVSGGSPMASEATSPGASSGGFNQAMRPAGTENMTVNGKAVTLTFSPI